MFLRYYRPNLVSTLLTLATLLYSILIKIRLEGPDYWKRNVKRGYLPTRPMQDQTWYMVHGTWSGVGEIEIHSDVALEKNNNNNNMTSSSSLFPATVHPPKWKVKMATVLSATLRTSLLLT